MSDVQIIQVETTAGLEEIVVIPNSDGFTSMLKSTYDEMIAKQDEASTL